MFLFREVLNLRMGLSVCSLGGGGSPVEVQNRTESD